MEQDEVPMKIGAPERPHDQGRGPERPHDQGRVPAPMQEGGHSRERDAAQARGLDDRGQDAAQTQARQERLEETAALLKRCFHKMQRGERSSQGHVVGLLWRKGEMTQRELQSYMKISQASLSELVKKLEERGMVERSADPDDRRRMLVRLTEQGRQDHQEHLQRSLDRGVALLDELTVEEQDELHRLLLKMLTGAETRETAARGSATSEGGEARR